MPPKGSPSAAAALRRSARLFASLGDETRLHLVARLCDQGPMSITRLGEGAGVTRQAVTKHLEVMARAGLVRARRQGRERIWALEPAHLEEARGQLERISRRWDDALERLRRLVEG